MTTSLLADFKLRSFVHETDFKRGLLEEIFEHREHDFESIAKSKALSVFLSSLADKALSQHGSKKLISEIESDFNRRLDLIKESELPVFLSITYYDFEREEVLADAQSSRELGSLNEFFFRGLDLDPFGKPKFLVKCSGSHCKVYLIGLVSHEGSRRGVLVTELSAQALLKRVRSFETRKPKEPEWILDRHGTIIAGPESTIGSNVKDIFGVSLENLNKVRSLTPNKNYTGLIHGPVLGLTRSLGIGGLSILEISPEVMYAKYPSVSLWGLLVFSLLSGLALMLAYVFRSFQVQNRMNSELHEAKELLETRIHERTSELEAANDELASEIRERKQSQEKIYQQAQILASITDTILIISTDRKIIYANATACELFGDGSEQSLVGRDCHEMLRDVGDICDDCLLDLMISEEKPYKKVTIWRDKGGRELWVYNTAFPYCDDQGRLLGAIVLSTDYSAQKEIEIALNRAKEHAEAASKAKSDFLARMSHEIRTPMYGILGTLELALDGELKAEQRDLLLTAKFSAEALQGILNDILDFSKIEARKIDLEEKIFSPLTVVESVFDTLAVKAREKGLELVSDVKPEIPAAMIGDPFRLRQILLNLVGNAVKFTDQGEIVISVFRKKRLRDQLWLEFVVSDTGIGVNPDKLKTIFDPFAQAEGFISRTFGGTGLGLAISSTLVNIMGGEIWADSVPGQGSSFHFSIPLKIIDDLQPLEEEYCTDPNDVRVLVVDDNPTNRRILVENMARWGFCSDEAPDAEQALQRLSHAQAEQRPYHLILLDQRLPGMSGLELLEHMGEAAITKTILLSSSANIQDKQESERLGVSGFLMKPIKQADLKQNEFVALGMAGKSDQELKTDDRQEIPIDVSIHALKVLLAEDNPVNQILIKKVLEKSGYEVTVVSNGRMAVHAVSEGAFDLVLMDIQMPEMDGLTATKLIRRNEERYGKHIPIFAMTAHAYKEAEQLCRESGMDGYLTKPISGAKLTKILAKIFTGKPSRGKTSSG
jgi:PAS domain S-box-containing protein